MNNGSFEWVKVIGINIRWELRAFRLAGKAEDLSTGLPPLFHHVENTRSRHGRLGAARVPVSFSRDSSSRGRDHRSLMERLAIDFSALLSSFNFRNIIHFADVY